MSSNSFKALALGFWAMGGDADANGNGRIDNDPNEWSTLGPENADLREKLKSGLGRLAARAGIDAAYQLLRTTRTVQMVRSTVQTNTVAVSVMEIIGVPTTVDEPNDTFVTASSAGGSRSFSRRIDASSRFWKALRPTTHASVADQRYAKLVARHLQKVDRTIGDLR